MEDELTKCKLRIRDLEELVASLYDRIELLESHSGVLQGALISSENEKGAFIAFTQNPDTCCASNRTLKEDGASMVASDGKSVLQPEEGIMDSTEGAWGLDSLYDETQLLTFRPCNVVAAPVGHDVSSQFEESLSLKYGESNHLARKKDKLFKYPRRHVALKIMYVGGRFHGFSSDSCTKRTVESELFAALEKTKLLVGERKDAKYSRCGRTDKGVSANGQIIALLLRSSHKGSSSLPVISNTQNHDRILTAESSRSQESSFALASGFDEIDYVGVLNRALPPDIQVLGWCYVPDGFHSRFSCMSREYKYFFVNEGLDIKAMRIAARKFEGVHDFRNFCKMDAMNVHNFVRKIMSFEVLPCDSGWGDVNMWMFRVRGTAFLWHQVRCMVAVLFMIGQQNEKVSIVDDLLDICKTPRKPQYVMASDANLVLHACHFEGLSFICPPSSASNIHGHFNSMIKEHLLAAAILKEAYNQMPSSGLGACGEETSVRNIRHIPLSRRPTEPSYEERHNSGV